MHDLEDWDPVHLAEYLAGFDDGRDRGADRRAREVRRRVLDGATVRLRPDRTVVDLRTRRRS